MRETDEIIWRTRPKGSQMRHISASEDPPNYEDLDAEVENLLERVRGTANRIRQSESRPQ